MTIIPLLGIYLKPQNILLISRSSLKQLQRAPEIPQGCSNFPEPPWLGNYEKGSMYNNQAYYSSFSWSLSWSLQWQGAGFYRGSQNLQIAPPYGLKSSLYSHWERGLLNPLESCQGLPKSICLIIHTKKIYGRTGRFLFTLVDQTRWV